MIDKATIDRIFETVRIEDVVSDFVTLRRRGANQLGLCPFHDEKTPSFMVSPAKNIFKCFGCGKGGNAVNFMMELEQLSYPDALRYIAKKYQIEIVEKELSESQQQAQNERESILVINEFAQQTFTKNLHQHEEGRQIGLSYFYERGFREDILLKFKLGYALNAKAAFTDEAIKQGYKQQYLTAAGLTVEGDNYKADRFRGRVIFPIHSISGRVVGFGGRILIKNDKTAKYLNSPESIVYQKSKNLYGIYFARQAMVKHNCCFIVEGYTDVMAMHQVGVENVVASSGTALSTFQIRQIKRFTNHIVMIFDGDAAGIKASLRGIDLILEEDMQVKVLPLPPGEDPDSFTKKMNSESFLHYVKEHQIDFIQFKAQLLLKESDHDPAQRAQLVNEMIQSIAMIPNAIARSVYIKECNALMGIPESVLLNAVNEAIRTKHTRARNTPAPKPEEVREQVAQKKIYPFDKEERTILQLLLKYGPLILEPASEDEAALRVMDYVIRELKIDQLSFQNPKYQQILDETEHQIELPDFSPEHYFSMHRSPEISELASDLLAEPHQLSKLYKNTEIDELNTLLLKEFAPKPILEYKRKYIELNLKKIMQKLEEQQHNNDFELIRQTLQDLQEMKAVHQEILKMLGQGFRKLS